MAVIATGLVVNEALKAVKELEAEGINARLINIHTINLSTEISSLRLQRKQQNHHR